MADPVQIEQIILNLATNAAHAMPDGGRFIIETANVILDEKHGRNLGGIKPGRYVLLAVRIPGRAWTTTP